MLADNIVGKLLELIPSYIEEIKEMRNNAKTFILFGAGKTSEYIVSILKGYGIQPTVFCDNDVKKVGGTIAGLNIISIEELKDRYRNSNIYITTQMYYTEIKNQLDVIGIQKEFIAKCDWICQFEWEHNYIEFIRQNQRNIENIFNILRDKHSKHVLWNRLAFLITRERKYAVHMRERKQVQYFADDIIDFRSVTNFVDVGTYTGDSILEFQKYANVLLCKIYGFEPDEFLYRTASKNLSELKFLNISLSNMAVSDKNGVAEVSAQLGRMQTIEPAVFKTSEEESSVEFQTCTLDSFFVNENLEHVFLKMDIEGAEMSALRGAKKFIEKARPVLAICVYHRIDDIIAIPDFIINLSTKYSLYLRHYSDNQTESVLYAIPDEVKG